MKTTVQAFMMLFVVAASSVGQDEIFSGPQAGERLTPFKVRTVVGKEPGKDTDVIKAADGKPILIVFVHKLTRPSIGVSRVVIEYAKQREKDGLQSAMVFLGRDRIATEDRINRAKHALPSDVYLFTDGEEGPEAYGLNRNVTLTVLLGVKNQVTDNFAIVQPGMAVDTPKIGAAIAKLLGDENAPTLAQMEGPRSNRRGRMDSDADADGGYRNLMTPVIQKDASKDEVDKAAKAVELQARNNKAFRAKLIDATSRIVGSGKLSNYGTEHAQEYLKKWSKLPKEMQDDSPNVEATKDEPTQEKDDSKPGE